MKPKVVAMFQSKDEAITNFYSSLVGEESADIDPKLLREAMKLLKKNRYVSGGTFALQEF